MAKSRKGAFVPHIGYSTNVHGGENLKAVERSLREYTVPIRKRIFGSSGCGLELRLGMGSARDLATAKARAAFKDFLGECGLTLFSVNAYPLTDFHARRVKETVYQPSWAQAARATWTNKIAEIVDDIAPAELPLSISTLGGCFRGHGHGPSVFRKLAANYLKSCRAFLEIGEASGRDLTLAAAPEPETTFETARDIINFFESHLLPLAFESWKDRGRKSRIESDLRRVFSANIDTCHLSVLFEDQVENLRLLEKKGIRLGKVHVTNAVALRSPFRSKSAYEDLRDMNEPKYFHQFCGTNAGGEVIWREDDLVHLPRKLDRAKHPDVAEIRSHFHVPLYLERYKRLYTTRDDTERALREIVKRRSCPHLVFETYTWPILTGRKNQREKLIDGISREYRWLLSTLDGLGVTPA